jgi:adenylate cyclase
MPHGSANAANPVDDMTCFSQISAYGKTLLGLAAQVGLDPSDNEETALRKRLAVVLCAGTLPLTVLWSAIYLAVGAPLAAAIPGFYSVFTPINTAIFARTHNLTFIGSCSFSSFWSCRGL